MLSTATKSNTAFAPYLVPVDCSHVREALGQYGYTRWPVLKRLPQPLNIMVKLSGSIPSAIACRGRWFEIAAITQPEYLSGFWWEEHRQCSFYIAVLKPAHLATTQANPATVSAPLCMVMLVYGHQNKNWQLEGFFD